jgi:hypothetical protein
MNFIPHPQHTRNLGAPVGWDHTKIHCGSLSISDTRANGYPAMASRWKLEGFEDVYMMLGSSIELAVYGQQHPPVSMVVIPADVTAEQVDAAIAKLRAFAKANGLEIKS